MTEQLLHFSCWVRFISFIFLLDQNLDQLRIPIIEHGQKSKQLARDIIEPSKCLPT